LKVSALRARVHSDCIVYLDQKLRHVYWDGAHLKVIAFKSSRRLDDSRSQDRKQYSKDLHNMCVGLLYTIFTGMAPQNTSLRPQPSSRNAVEARYTDIHQLDFSMEPQLSPGLVELLQRGAAQKIDTVGDFVRGLQRVASQHGWPFRDYFTSAASSAAREQMRLGLRHLRGGQEQLRQARDLFREALIQDDISPDLEDELRRLVLLLNEMLNQRALP